MTYQVIDLDTDTVVHAEPKAGRLASAFNYADAHFDKTGSDFRVVDQYGRAIPRSRLRAGWGER